MKKKVKSKFINSGFKVAGILGLVVLVISVFRALSPQPPYLPKSAVNTDEFNLFSDRLSKEVELLKITTQKQGVVIARIGKQISEQENTKTISTDIDEIKISLETLVGELNKLKNSINNPPLLVEPTSTKDSPDNHVKKEPVIYHTVRQGETLYSISKRYGLTVKDLSDINYLPEKTTLYVKQKLRIQK